MSSLSISNALEGFAEISEVRLVCLDMFRTAEAGQNWFPEFPTDATAEQIIEAATELIEYQQRCQELARRLASLSAIPVTDYAIWEYGL